MKILGTTSDVTICECCSKSNLKKTVCLSDQFGGIVYYGSDCAGKAVYGKKSAGNAKLIQKQAEAVDYAKIMINKWGIQKASIAIWNKFGYTSQIKNDRLHIADFAII